MIVCKNLHNTELRHVSTSPSGMNSSKNVHLISSRVIVFLVQMTILFTVYITTIMNVVSPYMLILYAYLCTLCLWTRILSSRGFYVYYIYIYTFFCILSLKCFDYCCTEAYDYCILIEQ